jgi:hypothetical protein
MSWGVTLNPVTAKRCRLHLWASMAINVNHPALSWWQTAHQRQPTMEGQLAAPIAQDLRCIPPAVRQSTNQNNHRAFDLWSLIWKRRFRNESQRELRNFESPSRLELTTD